MTTRRQPKKGDARKAVAAASEHQSRAKGHTRASRTQSTLPAIDSRSIVNQRQCAAEAMAKVNATTHDLTPDQRHKLREIAGRVTCDEAKLLTALREVGSLTAADLSHGLRITAPHARICEMRKSGVPIIGVGWVRQPWGSGRPRTLKLYRIGEAE